MLVACVYRRGFLSVLHHDPGRLCFYWFHSHGAQTEKAGKAGKLAKLLPNILKIAHPNNTTVIHWSDDTTTSVRLMPGETYDKYAAFCACVVKKVYGNTSRAKKICDKYDYEAMQAREREKREKEEEKLRAKAKRRLKARIKRRARELYIEEEARKLAAANAFKADK